MVLSGRRGWRSICVSGIVGTIFRYDPTPSSIVLPLVHVLLNKRRGRRVMAQNKIEKCAHPGCECTAQQGSKYCSPYCEIAGDVSSIACECGHAECTVGATAKATG